MRLRRRAATDVLGSDPFFLANADGSNPVQVALIQPAGNAQAVWAPDSHRIALIYEVLGVSTMFVANVDGTSQAIDLGGLKPWDVAWLPPNGDRLLIRAEDATGRMDLYTLRPDGTERIAFGLPGITDYGQQYTLSGPSVSPDGTTIAYNGIDPIPGQLESCASTSGSISWPSMGPTIARSPAPRTRSSTRTGR